MDEHSEKKEASASNHTVTHLYEQAKSGNAEAEKQLWHVYVDRLHGLARSVLSRNGVLPNEASEQSVVNQAFASFFTALREGRYQDVRDRHELWCLLATITRNRALDRVKRQNLTKSHTVNDGQAWLENAKDAFDPQGDVEVSDLIQRTEAMIRERAVDSDALSQHLPANG